MSAQLSVTTESTQTLRPSEISVDNYAGPALDMATSTFALGSWHGDGKELEAALSDMADRCPELMPLARFLLKRLPRYLLCSNNLKTEEASSRYLSMGRALRRKWMGMQARELARINVMLIDCDGPNWRAELDALIARGLSPPTFTVVSPVRTNGNKRTGEVTQDRDHETAHLYWVLAYPVDRKNPKAYDFYKRARAAMTRVLGGDPAAAGHLGKNPFHRAYVTEVGPLRAVGLRELCRPLIEWCEEGEYFLGERTVSRDGSPRYMPGVPAREAPGGASLAVTSAPLTDAESAQWGRLFEARHGIYATRTRDYGLVLAMVEEHAAAVGSRATPQDMRHTARSIHKFMVRTYAGGSQREGIDHYVMTREHIEAGERLAWVAMSKQEKRVTAAARTNAVRKGATRGKLAAAAMRLWAAGEVVTQEALAGAAGVSERTARRLWDDPGTLDGASGTAITNEPVTRSYQGFTHEGTEGVGDGQSTAPTLRALAAASRERAEAAREHARLEAGAALARERRAVGLAKPWRKLAAAMRRPGAVPQPVPPCPTGSPPAVHAARAEAVAAHRDARRRLQARRDRAAQVTEAEARRQDFTRWAGAADAEAWEAWMAGKAEWWDRMAEAVAGHGTQARAQVRLRRAVAFNRYRAEWEEAVEVAALGDGERAVRAAVRALPRRVSRARFLRGDVVRTTLDALDRIVATMPTPREEKVVQVIQERARARAPEPIGAGTRDPAEMKLSARERFRRHLTP